MTERMTQAEFRRATGTEPMKLGAVKAKGRPRRQPGEMTSVEKQMHHELGVKQTLGEIEWFAYEPVKLRLADRTFYTPDFCVMHTDGTIEFREVKGSWKAPHQEDSRVKIKVAAEQFQMFRFTSYSGGGKKGWKIEEFNK